MGTAAPDKAEVTTKHYVAAVAAVAKAHVPVVQAQHLGGGGQRGPAQQEKPALGHRAARGRRPESPAACAVSPAGAVWLLGPHLPPAQGTDLRGSSDATPGPGPSQAASLPLLPRTRRQGPSRRGLGNKLTVQFYFNLSSRLGRGPLSPRTSLVTHDREDRPPQGRARGAAEGGTGVCGHVGAARGGGGAC